MTRSSLICKATCCGSQSRAPQIRTLPDFGDPSSVASREPPIVRVHFRQPFSNAQLKTNPRRPIVAALKTVQNRPRVIPASSPFRAAFATAALLVAAHFTVSPRAFAAAPPPAAAVEISPAHRAFFESKIRPVLVKQCYSCHSADAKKLGGRLFLDTRDGILTGGESGPALVPGQPERSLLVQSLRYQDLEMPPKERLPAAVVNDFVEWVKLGAPDPRGGNKTTTGRTAATNAALWSVRPIAKPPPPAVTQRDWCWDSVDQFVLAKIEAAGLAPAADAAPAVLARRLYHDLTGLPPTHEQVKNFAADHARHGRHAVERLVDALLALPQFGERWGRHWLDVARYGESNGNDGLSRNSSFPHAWRYRDYVIQAFNADVPFDRFVTEQIAGDLLPSESPAERDRLLIATGFLALTCKPAKAMNDNFDMDIVADQIDVVSAGIMGLSVACARCHDHKHDPIPTRDYYALAGIFSSTETLWGTAAKEPLTAPATALHELQAAPRNPPPPAEKPAKVVAAGGALAAAAAAKKDAKGPPIYAPGTPLAMGVRERAVPADCKVNISGESKKLGASVPRGFLSACGTNGAPLTIDAKQSGRLQLAQWLTRDDHPLTSRVIANRVWLHLFGQGIVRTPDDFGVFGDAPTHPELLDHLAQRLQRDGWSLKRLIRALVLSRTYQLSSEAAPRIVKADPDNELLARHARRRLDAESLRDSILAASGQLDRQPGQGSLIQHMDVLINKLGSLHRPSNHRSVYLCLLRNSLPPELLPFNMPDGTGVTGRRDVTTLPAQSLFLLNSPFLVEQARHLAARVLASPAATDDAARIRHAYQFALSRQPLAPEIQRATEMLRHVAADLRATTVPADNPELTAWAVFCQALLASNEFRYVD